MLQYNGGLQSTKCSVPLLYMFVAFLYLKHIINVWAHAFSWHLKHWMYGDLWTQLFTDNLVLLTIYLFKLWITHVCPLALHVLLKAFYLLQYILSTYSVYSIIHTITYSKYPAELLRLAKWAGYKKLHNISHNTMPQLDHLFKMWQISQKEHRMWFVLNIL